MKMGCRICELLSDQSQHGNHHHSDHVTVLPSNQIIMPQLREMLLAAYLLRGYYQPAGPLITAHHHPQHKPSALPPLEAGVVTASTTSPGTLTPPAPPQHQPQPPPAASGSTSRGGDESSDNDVVITATSCSNYAPPGHAPPPHSAGSGAPVYRYTTGYAPPPPPHGAHHQYPYVVQHPVAGGQQYHYPAPAVQYPAPAPPPPPPPHHYHAAGQELCYPPYYHPKTYAQPVAYTRRYAPSQYYPPEQLYPSPSDPPSSRQMVATASTSYQPDAYPPPAPMVDPYPTVPPAPPYYPGYPPAPPCYTHSPPARGLQYIDTGYQGCPCPMQSCPKNVHTGPLTGEGKGPDPSAAMYLPPVALALPLEPPHALGPPSPARGSAGMHPTPASEEVASSESRVGDGSTATQAVGLLSIRGDVDAGSGRLTTDGDAFTPTEKRKAEPTEEEATPANKRPRNVVAASKKATCKNQPLSTANSCSLHIAKQNAKKRKSSGTEDLTENLEPEVKKKMTKPRAKESVGKAVRPKLCPVKKEVKAKPVKSARKSIDVFRVQNSITDNQTVCVPSNKCEVAIAPTIKTVQKTVPKTVPKSAPKGKPPARATLNSTAPKPKKPAATKARVKLNGLAEAPKKVKCRRSTDSANHLLRSAGPQADAPAEAEAPLKVKAASKKKSPIMEVCPLPPLRRGNFLRPKWSNGWCWEGEPFQAKVHLNSEESLVERLCYPCMRHTEGDLIRPRDCVLLKSGTRKADLPFVAKVAQLWENPDDGEMMVSLLWYYRPEHTDQGRRDEDMKDEIFASKHKDTNSVACIEDKCYVLTFNEYCRYRAVSRRLQDGLREKNAVVPDAGEYPYQSRLPGESVAPEMVFFCRRVYDFRQKRILKNPG